MPHLGQTCMVLSLLGILHAIMRSKVTYMYTSSRSNDNQVVS